jgi:hypothetical protein
MTSVANELGATDPEELWRNTTEAIIASFGAAFSRVPRRNAAAVPAV